METLGGGSNGQQPQEDEQVVQETLGGGVNGQQPANEQEEELPMRLPSPEEQRMQMRQQLQQRFMEQYLQKQQQASEERQRKRQEAEDYLRRKRYELRLREEAMKLLANPGLLEQIEVDLRLGMKLEDFWPRPPSPGATLEQIEEWRRERRRKAEEIERRRLHRLGQQCCSPSPTSPQEDEQDVQGTLDGRVNGQKPANEPEELPVQLPSPEERLQKLRQERQRASDEYLKAREDRQAEDDLRRRRNGLMSREEEKQLLGDILRLLSLRIQPENK